MKNKTKIFIILLQTTKKALKTTYLDFGNKVKKKNYCTSSIFSSNLILLMFNKLPKIQTDHIISNMKKMISNLFGARASALYINRSLALPRK